MKLLLSLMVSLSAVLILPGIAMSLNVGELIDKAKLKESEYEQKIGGYVKVETLENTAEPRLVNAVYYGKGVKTRNDISLTNKGKKIISTIIYDGKDKWTITGKAKIKAPQDARGREKDMLENKKFLGYLNRNCKIEKFEKFNGRDCYVVSAAIMEKSKANGKVLMWIDKDNYNTYEHLMLDKSGKESARTVFSDFRDICKGVSVPFKTEVYLKGKLLSRIMVTSFKTQQKLSDDLFDVSKFNAPELGQMMTNLKEQQNMFNNQKK